MDLIDELKKLKSAWGMLGVGTMLFPGAAYWLNLKSIKTSPLDEYYLMAAIPLGALALLLALMLSGDRRSTALRNLIVVLAVIVTPVMIFGFVRSSADRADWHDWVKGPQVCAVYAFGNNIGDGYVSFTIHTAGRIRTIKRPCECFHSGPLAYEDCKQTAPDETIEDVINPAEYTALVWFTLCIITLTVTFTLIAKQFST